jgi:hypothetical protein
MLLESKSWRRHSYTLWNLELDENKSAHCTRNLAYERPHAFRSFFKEMSCLELTFEWEPELTSMEDASDARLEFYISRGITAGDECIATVLPGKQAHIVRIPLQNSSFEAGQGLTVRAFVHSVNDRAEPCYIGAGTAFFGASELFKPHDSVTERRSLCVPQAINFEAGTIPVKGTIRLHISASPRIRVTPPTKHSYVPQNAEFITQQLSAYMQKSSLIYSQLKPTVRQAEGLQLPLWKFGHIQLPGEAFVAPRATPSPESWWQQVARIGLRRFHDHDMSDEMARTWLLSQATPTEVMTCVALMHAASISYYSTYVSDGIYVNKKTMHQLPGVSQRFKAGVANPFAELKAVNASECTEFLGMEQFQDAEMRRVRGPGVDASTDCEDGTAEVGNQAMELATARFSDPVLQRMQSVRRDYIICTALCYVNGAAVTDPNAQLGGHAVPVYIHKNCLMDMLERYNTARPVVPPSVCSRVASSYGQDPIIVVESTGLMWPVGDDARAQRISNALSSIRTHAEDSPLSQTRFVMPNSRSAASPFYHTMASLMPLEFADHFAVIHHAAVQMNGSNASPTLGIPFAAFLRGRSANALVPIVELNEDLLRIIRNGLAHRFPIVAYPEPVCNLQAQLAVLLESAKPGKNRKTKNSISFYPRYSQITSSFIAKLKQFIVNRRLAGFDFEEENVGGDAGGFRLTFYQ